MKVFNKDALVSKNTVLFNGEYSGFQRFDIERYPSLKRFEETARGAFWVPEEYQLTKDKNRFKELPKERQDVLTEILLFLTLADSVQNRALSFNFKEQVSDPSIEPLFGVWEFFELIHSLSYSHIIRGLYDDYTAIFDLMSEKEEIAERFNTELLAYSGGGIAEKLVYSLFLEGVKFFISFLTIYTIAHQNKNLDGLATIIKLIQHDETMHCVFSAEFINILRRHPEEDAAGSRVNDVDFVKIANDVYESEMNWFKYLKTIDHGLPISEKEASEFIKHRVNFVCKLAGEDDVYVLKEPDIHKWFINYSDLNRENTAQQEKRGAAYNIAKMKKDW